MIGAVGGRQGAIRAILGPTYFRYLFIMWQNNENDKSKNFISKAQVIFHLIDLNEQSKNDNGDNPWISIFTEIQAKNPFYRASLMTGYWDPY